MNKVILIGNLTRDPEFQTTNSGVSVCRFSIAVRRNFPTPEGEYEADFFNVTAWRGLADNCHTYLAKGRKACVSGRLQNRTYEAQDGTNRTVTDVIAEEVEFLSPKQDQEEKPKKKVEEFEPIDDDDLPF